MVAQHRKRPAVSKDELVVGLEKGWVSPHGLIKKLNRLLHVLLISRTEADREEPTLGLSIKVESGQVGGGRFFNRRLLVRRKLRLQLLGDGLGDLALDGEDIRQVAIVGLGPKMRVSAGVD